MYVFQNFGPDQQLLDFHEILYRYSWTPEHPNDVGDPLISLRKTVKFTFVVLCEMFELLDGLL